MDNSEKSFVAFLVGAAAGAIAGLLIAPESGDNTRKKLNKQADKLMHELEDSFEANSKKLKDFTDSALKEVEKYGAQAKDMAKK